MINLQQFTSVLIKNDLGPVIEVPCSYLKDFFNYLWDSKRIQIENPVNEAVAMGLATGSYLSTGKIPIVAIQNSGFMITLNAITSLNQIYEIPVFFMISWRGEEKDAPEHNITGKNLIAYLKTFKIPNQIINEKKYRQQIKELVLQAKKTKKPVAAIIRKNIFESYKSKPDDVSKFEMTRYDAISIIKQKTKNRVIFLSSTGFPTRDSFAAGDTPDFYMVGSMGHTLSTSLGIAANTRKKVIIFDGEGSAFMHLGGFSSFNSLRHKNLIYIILDNERYESTGNQKTCFRSINMLNLAKIFGFPKAFKVVRKKELEKLIEKAVKDNQSYFIQIKLRTGESHPSKRVSDVYTCSQIRDRFMKQFKNTREKWRKKK